MPTFDLTDDECQMLMNRLIATDPLLMKIGAQLREQQTNIKQKTNSQEVPGNSGEVVSSRAN